MPSVGPQLPPHLQKRKRSSSDDNEPTSPPRKVPAATLSPSTLGPTLPPLSPTTNPDELDINGFSEDDYGPSVAATSATKAASPPLKRALGPALPPTSGKNPDELALDDDSSGDGYGLSVLAHSGKPPTAAAPAAAKRVLGPAPAPAPLCEMPSRPADADSDSSDDDYGPSLPPALGSAAESASIAQQAAEKEGQRLHAVTESKKPQRAEWMLVPPSDSDWTGRVDPTKLKNRKFASGKGAKAPAEKSGISTIWTETPEEKRRRLADEVLGRAEVATSSRGNKAKEPSTSREDELTEKRIREYNEKNRGRSLMEEKARRQERGEEKIEEDDPSKRGFDRDKDMALGGRMGGGEKREMLAKARDFGSRFQRGKYL